MKCPYCNDTLDHDYCNTCQECVIDDAQLYYRDDEEFEQPDSREQMAHFLHTNEFQNEAYR